MKMVADRHRHAA